LPGELFEAQGSGSSGKLSPLSVFSFAHRATVE